MARKKQNNYDEDSENVNWGSGEFSGKLLDKIDDDDDEITEDEIVEDEILDDEANPADLIDETEEVPEVKAKRKGNIKSKLIGKHSLKYDTIYKGKKETTLIEDEYYTEHIIKNAGGSLDIDDSDINSEESKNNIDSYRDSVLKEQIYKILKNNTDIKFLAHMRKPAKTDFNAYFALLLKELSPFGYSNTEIFIELSGYFSPNVWNMFLLLDKSFGKIITNELKEKYGLSDISKFDFLAE